MVRKRRIKDFSTFQQLDQFIDFNPIKPYQGGHDEVVSSSTKKILSRGEAIFERSLYMIRIALFKGLALSEFPDSAGAGVGAEAATDAPPGVHEVLRPLKNGFHELVLISEKHATLSFQTSILKNLHHR
jgi:hypothetical protein